VGKVGHTEGFIDGFDPPPKPPKPPNAENGLVFFSSVGSDPTLLFGLLIFLVDIISSDAFLNTPTSSSFLSSSASQFWSVK